MPLPEKFYNMYNDEVTLEQLCTQEPSWAANRIRHLTKQVDELSDLQQAVQADAKRPWVCMCGMKHFKPHDGLKCQCGAVYHTA